MNDSNILFQGRLFRVERAVQTTPDGQCHMCGPCASCDLPRFCRPIGLIPAPKKLPTAPKGVEEGRFALAALLSSPPLLAISLQ